MKKWILFTAGFALIFTFILVSIGTQNPNIDNNLNENSEDNTSINWYTDLNSASSEAENSNLRIFTLFTADWCSACRKLDAETLSDPQVQEKLSQDYVALKVDVDSNPQLSRDYRILSIPTLIILDANGNVLRRMEGFQSSNQLLSIL